MYSPCSHICVEKKIGYQCKCYEGFKLSENNRTCVGEYREPVISRKVHFNPLHMCRLLLCYILDESI